jgi:GntR family transcriptional regulator
MLLAITSRKKVQRMSRALWRVRQDVPMPMTSHHPHEQVAAALRADILSGKLAPGEQLPGQRELGEKLGVAPNTVAQALRLLEKEGLVETAPRRRSRVLQPASAIQVRLHEDGLLRPRDPGDSGHDDIRRGDPGTDAAAVEALAVAPDAALSVRQAVLLQAGTPWALQTLFTPAALGPLRREDSHASNWDARPATTEECSLLRSKVGTTVFEIRRVGFTDERPTSYLLTVVRADRVTIRTGSAS